MSRGFQQPRCFDKKTVRGKMPLTCDSETDQYLSKNYPLRKK